ncbi:hypothetical protein MLD38_005858 [Melastoma candidum]|uniref:Uncharacterized protein n=1 Tax=Melastoma candidum TaxID=119954 RepID=A0ACB9RPR4_9MYRT|nr:hypothetical protein MLD38_005858 [Melastoma candidum]
MARPRPVLLLVLLLSSFRVAFPAATDEESLLQFKRSLTNNGALDSWVPGSSVCKWTGVICSVGIITGLHLNGLGLSGTIDVASIEGIRALRTLSFENNSFSGPIPEFSRLGPLKALYLSQNRFSGTIPDDFFSHMSSLKKVLLAHNSFAGNIPSSLAGLDNLMELNLQGNQFSGQIPPIKKDKLTVLDLSNNQLEGPIPESLSKFPAASFQGNPGLCGVPLTVACSDLAKPLAVAAPTTSTPEADGTDGGEGEGGGSKVVIWVLVGIVVAGVLFSLYSTRKKESDFSVLGKEVVHEVVDIPAAASTHSRTMSSKKGSVAKKGSQRGKDMGDLVVVNDEKGPFGLSDLMKAAAEVLGNGGLGSAYKAVMSNGLSVVVKRIREMNQLSREGFDAEMRRLGGLRHENILTPLAYHYRKEEKLLVSEFVSKGSLLYVLHGDRGITHAELNWLTRLRIIRGIARGLGFLHEEFSSYDLPHGNLKSSNVLLNDNYDPLLNDYAFHPLINSPQAVQAMFAYKAPEFQNSQEISPKCDVYCLGIVILEILTGKFPSQYLSNRKGGIDIVHWVQTAIAEGREHEVLDPEIASTTESRDQIVALLRVGAACTESDPDQRMSLREAIQRIQEAR